MFKGAALRIALVLVDRDISGDAQWKRSEVRALQLVI